jgi:hypothetical protein
MAHCRACNLGGTLLALVLTRWGHRTQTVDVSHTSSWSDRPWSPLSMSICINAHWHYISYAKLHIVDNNSLKIRGRGIKMTCCPMKKWLGSFHLQKIAFGFSKDFILFWNKSYWKFIPVFHLYVPATKWPGHTCIVLPMSVIPKYFSCYHFFSLCFEILLTWYLVCGCIMISYRSSLRFVPVQWFFGRVVTLGLWNLAKYLVVTTFCDMLGDIDLIFGIWVYKDELQIKFHSGPMIFGRAMARRLWNLAKYLVVSPLYFTMIWYIDMIFWYACIIISYRSTLKFVPVEWYFANLQALGFEIWPPM